MSRYLIPRKREIFYAMLTVLQLDDMLAEHRKQLKASQKTTLDQLQQEYEVDIENTKQHYRAEV